MIPTRPAELLLVEDNPAEAELIQRVFKREKIRNNINHVTTGEEALLFLRKEAEYQNAPDVDLVLLDLNLPGLNGHEVLEEIRADKKLSITPVIMLTNSRNPSDVEEAYRNHVNCYVAKPSGIADLANIVQNIDQFWFQVVVRPTKD